MVLVACGPYTTSDSITYEPLLDLISVINRDQPDVCILVGHTHTHTPWDSFTWAVSLRKGSSVVLNS